MNRMNIFENKYPGISDVREKFCPYRVCPIGAHVDHQFGKITGLAIDKGIYITYSPVSSGMIELTSLNFDGEVKFDVNNIPKLKQNDWADYLRGATFALLKKYELNFGLYGVIEGEMPVGGLSSSASVVISYLSALCDVNDIHLSEHEMITISQSSERDYVGVNVGKLDQSCEVLCKKNHLLYLDTKDDTYQLIPQKAEMAEYEIAIFFSGVQRTLVGSVYNLRVDESKAAAYALEAFAGLRYGKFNDTRLRDVPYEVYEKYKAKLPDNWRKRAEHFYSELKRVEDGVNAWKNGDLASFGKLSFESGYSSIVNYETGSDELKQLYNQMLHIDGIYGGRFSGAGFKGCCMALIDPSYKDEIKTKMTEEYLKVFPKYSDSFSVHFCKSSDGVDL